MSERAFKQVSTQSKRGVAIAWSVVLTPCGRTPINPPHPLPLFFGGGASPASPLLLLLLLGARSTALTSVQEAECTKSWYAWKRGAAWRG